MTTPLHRATHLLLLPALLLAWGSTSAEETAPTGKSRKTAAEEKPGTGKRLEDDPYALEKLRKLLEGGVPELMTVKVKVPSGANETTTSASTTGQPGAARKAKRGTAEPAVPSSLALAPDAAGKGASEQTQVAKAAAHPGKAAKGHGEHDAHWDYEGDYGPHAWGKLKPEFNACNQGKTQSPIHIQPGDAIAADLEPLSFDYGPLLGKIEHNGHTIQVNVTGNHMMSVRGKVYKLAQFHFHHPAEEMINYKGFPMVAHLVHKDSEGKLAVVAVLMELGEDNPVLGQVWSRMPMKTGEQFALDSSRTALENFLPKERAYYAFQGSLTTPPCSEGVSWFILKQPVKMSEAQLMTFKRLFPLNARPTQALNARLVQESR